MIRFAALMLATITAITLIGRMPESAAEQYEQRARTSFSSLSNLTFPDVFGLQDDDGTDCRDLDRSYVQLDASLDGELAPGRVFTVSDGTLAVLIVVAGTDDDGRATLVDFAASLRINAVITRSGDRFEAVQFDEPVRNQSNLGAPEGGPIDEIDFCYMVDFPMPPKAGQPTATVDSTVEPTETATALTLDLSDEQTAVARVEELEATSTAAAAEVATSETRAGEIEQTATAAALQAEATNAAQETAIAERDAKAATAEAEAAAAEQTSVALQLTASAPTETATAAPPTETPTPSPTDTSTPNPPTETATAAPPTETATPSPEPTIAPPATVVAFETSGEQPFAEWQPAGGWDIDGEVASTDGSGASNWLVVPVPAGLGSDVTVDVEIRITGGDICPRNFGIGIRISETGYYAAGIEWACDPEVVFWSGTGETKRMDLPDGVPGDDWHTFRISAVGNHVTVSIDGNEVLSHDAAESAEGQLVAIWSDNVPLEIRSVTVSGVTS